MNFNRDQINDLIIGSTAVLLIYLVSGYVQEHLINFPYKNVVSGQSQTFPIKLALVFSPGLFSWVLGYFYNSIFLNDRTAIPEKNSASAGMCVFISTITYTLAVSKTSFPIVMAIKSCNLLSVLVIAVFCSQVKEKALTLGPKKIIVGLIVTFGVILFSFFDPESKSRRQSSEIMGIVFMIISLIADGFLPDFQAVIKSQYKPQPTQMLEAINKWVAIFCFVGLVGTLDLVRFSTFMIEHPEFTYHLVIFSLAAFVGQLFVYRMIKQFKQHIVPFVITVRKVLTVIISIIFYQHATSNLQLLGMFIIFGATFFQFASEVKKNDPKIQKFQQVQHQELVEIQNLQK